MVEFYIIGSILAASVLSGIGAFFLFMNERHLDSILIYLVSVSTGAIFGGTFIHLIPRYASQIGFTHFTGLIVLLGVAGSHLLEKVVHWHCHHLENEVEPFSYMVLVADSLHNVIDGLLIASSYFISISAGIASTLAVILHKVPKEVGDFGTLVHGGFSRKKALLFNIAVGAFMFLGAGIVYAFSSFNQAEAFLLPLAIGNFVYIAGTDLMPEIRDTEEEVSDLLVLLAFILGIGMMYSIVLLKPLLGI